MNRLGIQSTDPFVMDRTPNPTLHVEFCSYHQFVIAVFPMSVHVFGDYLLVFSFPTRLVISRHLVPHHFKQWLVGSSGLVVYYYLHTSFQNVGIPKPNRIPMGW